MIRSGYLDRNQDGLPNTGKLAEGLRHQFAKLALLTRCIGSNPILSAIHRVLRRMDTTLRYGRRNVGSIPAGPANKFKRRSVMKRAKR